MPAVRRKQPSLLTRAAARRTQSRAGRPEPGVVLVGWADAARAYARSKGLSGYVHVSSIVDVQAMDITKRWRVVEVYGAHEEPYVRAKQMLELRMNTRDRKCFHG
jgi:hypothetical protein